MPSAFPSACKMVDEIFKMYSQNYVKLSDSGPIVDFVCDFVEDQNGVMYFLKIKEYELG